MNLCFSVLLVLCILQSTYGAISRRVFPIEPNKPEVCEYKVGRTLAPGESFRTFKYCRQYTCDKDEAANQLVLTTVTCGVMSVKVDPPCYLGRHPPYTPYPQCCQPKIVCPEDSN
ncbi:U-scoloptoxin(16)-Ssd1a-like [Rhodnius prolixus]|uniref:SVWC domain-containing protein n=1 Tax=Rhodnius prolixus TaxID=13249 RepID=T1HG58_RHOPR